MADVSYFGSIYQSQSTGAAGGYKPVAPKKKRGGPPPPRVSQLTPVEQKKLKETGTTGLRSTSQLTPQQRAAVLQQQQTGRTAQWSGQVQESFKGEPQATRYYVKGEEVAVARAREETFEPRGAVAEKGKTARLTFERPEARREVEISRAKLTEKQFQAGQQSATDLVFGGGVPSREEYPQGMILLKGTEVEGGQAGELYIAKPSSQIKQEQKQIAMESIRKRQELSFGERVKTAYGTSGEVNIRGGIRAAMVPIEIGTEKVFGKEPKGILGTPVSSQVAEDTALFLGFSPAFATTTQIQRQVAEVSRVRIAGATEQTGKAVRTDAAFTVSRAGKSVKGVAVAKSIPKVLQRKVVLDLAKGGKAIAKQPQKVILTRVKAQTFRTGVRFPTGTPVLKPIGKQITSAEIATVTQRGKLFFTRSVGVAGREPYIAGGVSQRFGMYIKQLGGTISRSGQKAFSTGLFKIKTTPAKTFFTVTTKGTPRLVSAQTTPAVTTANVQAIKNVVSKSIQIPPTQPTPFVVVPTTRTAMVRPREIRQITSPQSLQRTISIQKTQQVVTPSQIIRQESKTKQAAKTIQSQVPMQREIQKATTIQKQVPLQTQIQKLVTIPKTLQKQKTIQKPIQKQKTIQKPIITRIPTPRIPIEPIVPPFKLKPARQEKNIFGKFPVFGRRWGKWKPIGYGRTPVEAAGIGRSWAKQTLGVSFKVPSYKGLVPKFRTKIEKGEKIFIEPRGKRLKKGTEEIPEIQYWKKLKGGIKQMPKKRRKKRR